MRVKKLTHGQAVKLYAGLALFGITAAISTAVVIGEKVAVRVGERTVEFYNHGFGWEARAHGGGKYGIIDEDLEKDLSEMVA